MLEHLRGTSPFPVPDARFKCPHVSRNSARLTDLASGTVKACLPSLIGYIRGSADLLTARDLRCFSLPRTVGPPVQSYDQSTNSQRPLSLKSNSGLGSICALLRPSVLRLTMPGGTARIASVYFYNTNTS
jgi:hypothetical protein